MPPQKIYATLMVYIFLLYYMSIESPERVDLSKQEDIAKLKANLTQDEQTALDAYFNTQREGIIYITQNELLDLQAIMSWEELNTLSPQIQDATIIWDINTFMEEQVEEWLGLSDLLGDNTENNEALEPLKIILSEALFWNEGILWNQDISESAQNNFTTWFLLSIVEKIATWEINIESLVLQEWWDPEMVHEAFLAQLMGTFEAPLSTFDELASATQQVPAGTINTLMISDNGETNSIFMNPSESKAFFDELLSGTMTQEQIETLLESKNNINDIPPINLAGISEDLWGNVETIKQLVESIRTRQEVAWATITWGQVTIPDIPVPTEVPERKNFLDKLLLAITEFLSWLTSSLDDFIGDTGSSATPAAQADAPAVAEEVAASPVNTVRQTLMARISEGAFTGISADSIQQYLSSEGNIEKIIALLWDIPTRNGQDTIEEKINNLLFTNIESWENNKLQSFIEAGDLVSLANTNWSFNHLSFEAAITSYKEYRLAEANTQWLTYSEYFDNGSV